MKTDLYKVLEDKEAQLINGGGEGFFYDLGAACHKAWNEVKSWFD